MPILCHDPSGEVLRWLILGLQVLLIVLVAAALWRGAVPARHAAEAAYELREHRAWLSRLYGAPVDSSLKADFEAFMAARRLSRASPHHPTPPDLT